MLSCSARVVLYVHLSSSTPKPFRNAAKAARDNAEDSFIYQDTTFHIGRYGTVHTETTVDDLTVAAGLHVKWCIATSTDASVHPLNEPGFYSSYRLGCDRLMALVDPAGDVTGTPKVEVSGMSTERVTELFTMLIDNELALTRTAGRVILDA